MKKAILALTLVALMFIAGCQASGSASIDDPAYHHADQAARASR